MKAGHSKEGVVLLHGLGRSCRSMNRLAAAARRAGYATLIPDYPDRRQALTEIVNGLAPRIAAFAAGCTGPIHFVTHSLGGLVARALIATHRPPKLGRVVMLAPPNAGSEVADLLYRLRLNRIFMAPVGVHLRTRRLDADEALLGSVDFPLGIIAGDRGLDPLFPRLIFRRPNDGKVAIAATHVDGAADHIVLPVSHTLMMYDRRVIAQVMAFLQTARFRR